MSLTKVSGSILKDPLNLGEVSIGGTLTYEDVTNVDSVGIITARSGIHIDDSITHIGDTNTKIRFPAADTITAETNGSERLRITSSGQITTRGATGTSFNNAGTGDFGSFLTVNGGHTSNQWGILSLEGNTSANGYAVGAIQFINQNNANGSSGANNQSRLLAKIDVSSVTSDSNAGDDSGGTLQFFTKPEAGQPTQRLSITSDGKVVAGGNGAGYPSRLQSHGAGNVLDLNSTSGAAVIRFYESGTGRFDLRTNNGSSGLNFYDSLNGVERLRIGSAGQLGIAGANYGSSGQVLTSQGSGSAVQWASVSNPTLAHAFVFMDSQYFTSSVTLLQFNNSTTDDRSSGVTITRGGSERFTPTVAGVYLVQGMLHYYHAVGGSYTPVLYLYRNGSSYTYTRGIVSYSGGHYDSLNVQAIMTFNGSSDYVDMRAAHNAGGNATMQTHSTFSMFRVGA